MTLRTIADDLRSLATRIEGHQEHRPACSCAARVSSLRQIMEDRSREVSRQHDRIERLAEERDQWKRKALELMEELHRERRPEPSTEPPEGVR